MVGKKGVNSKGSDMATHRDQMWTIIRARKRFNFSDMLSAIPGVTYANAFKFFECLETLGYVAKIGDSVAGRTGEYQGYELQHDPGPLMPLRVVTLRQKMWKSIRIMKRFNIPDIIRTVPKTSYNGTAKYIGLLEKAGFVGKVGTYVSGRAGEYQGYVLLKDAGPIMPVLRSDRRNDASVKEPVTGGQLEA